MQARALRTVLLIQAVEETDRSQQVLPGAERVGATRSALDDSAPPPEPHPGEPLQEAAEGFLARRAEVLLGRLRSRAPAVGHLLTIADGGSRMVHAMLPLAFVAGLVLALLAGRRINLFSFPLLALVIWNLFVYGLTLARALGKPGAGWLAQFWFGKLYSRWLRRETDALLVDSTRFNAPLAPGLARFASDWWASAQPLFELRARWLLHLCAALAALGLITGVYFQAFIRHDLAGWSAGSLAATSARTLLIMLYGPASALTGIAIPSVQGLEALRWDGAAGGGVATPWAHLIAVTATLYVIVPRLLAATGYALAGWRLSRRLAAPPGLSTYAQLLLESARPA